MIIELKAGITLHPAPCYGALVLDRTRLTTAETEVELAALLATGPLHPADVPPSLHAAVASGVSQGWLTARAEEGAPA
ncbi:hypothetical protein [Streptomyces sp. NBC_00354]|uniref:hypothetical protein n=1 Tax=Streptomyces sp. NBC_00354 TaxID=2975723 RepID=UPI002E253A2B